LAKEFRRPAIIASLPTFAMVSESFEHTGRRRLARKYDGINENLWLLPIFKKKSDN